jgi:hypothetical protein
MKGKFNRFFIRLVIFSFVLILFAFLLEKVLPEGSVPSVLPWVFLLFFSMTLAVHWTLLRITLLKPSRFVSYYMLATVIKLLVYMIAVLAYVFFVKEGILSFIIAFFALYIFYTVFEVAGILSQTKEPAEH